MSRPRRWDAIVVGGRVAGAATAMLLARGGLKVLCLERSRHGSDTVSTHALMRGGVLQLHRWGLLDALVAAGTPAVRRTVFHYGRETAAVAIRPSPGVEALYAPRRTVLDPLLVDAAVAAGARVEHSATVTGLVRDDAGAVVGVRVRRADGRVRHELATLVIGADGVRSVVAHEVGARLRLRGEAASDVVYTYVPGLPADGYEWFYDTGCAGGLIPTDSGQTCVFVSAAAPGPDQVPTSQESPPGAAFWGRLPIPPALAARLDGTQPSEALRRVPGRPAYLRRGAGPGWALVGDAGCWKDPLSTHGLTDALRDAELLARAVLRAPEPGRDRAEAMAAYDAQRERLNLPVLAATEALAGYAWSLEEVPYLLRALASAMTEEVDLLQDLPPDGAMPPGAGTARDLSLVTSGR